jgi:predicted nucleic acid-binding protein
VNDIVCVDSGLILKLVLPEADTPKAVALWKEWRSARTLIISTDLWRYEVTSVLRNKGHRGLLEPDEEVGAIATIHQMPIRFLRPKGLHRRAWEIARHFKRPSAYDAHYLALAELENCPFWTADERLYNAVASELTWVQWLGNIQLST